MEKNFELFKNDKSELLRQNRRNRLIDNILKSHARVYLTEEILQHETLETLKEINSMVNEENAKDNKRIFYCIATILSIIAAFIWHEHLALSRFNSDAWGGEMFVPIIPFLIWYIIKNFRNYKK